MGGSKSIAISKGNRIVPVEYSAKTKKEKEIYVKEVIDHLKKVDTAQSNINLTYNLYDWNTTYKDKKKEYDNIPINNFLKNLCKIKIPNIVLKFVINEIETNKEIYTDAYTNYRLSILKYRVCNYLGFKDLLLDGFFDNGYLENSSDERLYSTDIEIFPHDYKTISGEGTKYQVRETIIVDSEDDGNLKKILDKCKIMKRNNQIHRKIIELILSLMGHDCNDNQFNKFMSKYYDDNETTLINLGEIRNGLDRHKSLLFKYLCDNIGLNCCLIRKTKNNEVGLIVDDHCWNLIYTDDKKLVVDFRYFIGKIINPDNDSTKQYYGINLI